MGGTATPDWIIEIKFYCIIIIRSIQNTWVVWGSRGRTTAYMGNLFSKQLHYCSLKALNFLIRVLFGTGKMFPKHSA